MKKVSFSPLRTPVKVYNPRPNDFCRVCRESIRISGRSQIDLFGDKNQDFLRRFRGVAGKKIENIAGVSQVLCQKCSRTVLKYDKVLEQEKELLIFRENYKEEAMDFTDKLRKKRCAKDSPTCETTSEHTKEAREKSSPQQRTLTLKIILSNILRMMFSGPERLQVKKSVTNRGRQSTAALNC